VVRVRPVPLSSYLGQVLPSGSPEGSYDPF
jgi:hypothetical protein